MASVGAAVHGWDQTGSNGANLSFPIEFGIDERESDPNAARNQWLVGLVNSAPYIAIALCGSWLSDPCNALLGRRGTTFVAAIISMITPIGSACIQSWQQLFAVRLLLGIGMGLKASTVPIWNAENVPASIRGGMVMSWQMWDAFGIFLGFCANLICNTLGRLAWRLQLGSAFIPALILTGGILFCPESPRWLMKKRRYMQAHRSFLRLRLSPLQAARDMYYAHCQLEEEHFAQKKSNPLSRFGDLFVIPRIRRATLATFVVMLAQQMCGINIIAFYSSTVFSQAGYSITSSLLASWGFGFLNFLFAIPALFVIDTFGRRNLLLSTFPLMCLTLLGAGLSFLIPELSSSRIAMVALFIYLFCIVYSVGEGPVPFTIAAEVFPLSHREVGMGFGVATCFFWAAVLSLTWPRLQGALGSTGAFGFYAGLNLVAFVMIFFLVPETKQLTLEELDHTFEVTTSKHAGYQAGTWFPWFIQAKILRRDVQLRPLYDYQKEDHSMISIEPRAGEAIREWSHRITAPTRGDRLSTAGFSKRSASENTTGRNE